MNTPNMCFEYSNLEQERAAIERFLKVRSFACSEAKKQYARFYEVGFKTLTERNI